VPFLPKPCSAPLLTQLKLDLTQILLLFRGVEEKSVRTNHEKVDVAAAVRPIPESTFCAAPDFPPPTLKKTWLQFTFHFASLGFGFIRAAKKSKLNWRRAV
jgi:hypothetical protein